MGWLVGNRDEGDGAGLLRPSKSKTLSDAGGVEVAALEGVVEAGVGDGEGLGDAEGGGRMGDRERGGVGVDTCGEELPEVLFSIDQKSELVDVFGVFSAEARGDLARCKELPVGTFAGLVLGDFPKSSSHTSMSFGFGDALWSSVLGEGEVLLKASKLAHPC